MQILRIGLAQCRQTDSLATNERTIFRFLDEAAHAARERADGDFIGVLADDDGPQVTMEIVVSHPVNRRSALVVGTRGSIQLGGSYDDAVMMVDGAPDGAHGAAIKSDISSDMPLLLELRAFVEHIRGGPPPRSSLADGLLIVERIAALRVLAGLKD